MQRTPDVSVILVHHGSWDSTLRCVASIRATVRTVSCEIILVQGGGGEDRTADAALAARDLAFRTLRNSSDPGRATLCAQGMRLAEGRYLLLLSPEAQLLREAVDRAVHHAELHPDIAILGGRLISEDGRAYPWTAGRFPTPGAVAVHRLGLSALPVLARRGLYLRREPAEPTEVDWVSSAFMLVRRSALGDTGSSAGELIGSAGGDVELCRRLKRAGRRIVYFPHAQAVHPQLAGEGSRRSWAAAFKGFFGRGRR